MKKRSLTIGRYIVIFILLNATLSFAITPDSVRVMRKLPQSVSTSYDEVSLACPNIELPSITGPKSTFRYIDAGCETSLTIRPTFGVSGGQITGYNVYSIPYAPPFPLDMGTRIFINLDDVWGDIIQLPFNFCFFENSYNRAVVGANGLISFNTSVANYASGWDLKNKPNIPSTKFHGNLGGNWENAIYGVFEDIDPNKISSQHTNGSIRYGVLGEYPCRTLTVSWNKVPNYDCQSGTKYWDSFQIVLYEGTNVIDVYVLHKSRCPQWNLGRGIIGIQNQTCTKAIAAPNRNTTDSWTADREAWRFAPISTPQYTITYYEGQGINGRVLGTGEQITIDPTTLDAITARLQFTAANGDYFDLRDTAIIVKTEPERVVTTKVICDGGSYYWRGANYAQSGIYTEGMGNSNGCYDKIYELQLTIDSERGHKEKHNICEGEAYAWKGKQYSVSGIYYNRIRNNNGCEIIDTLVLNVNKKYAFYTSDTICQGEAYQWRRKSYTQSGHYKEEYTTIAGCDSIYYLDLVVSQNYAFNSNEQVCEGESFRWRGQVYKDRGVYYDSLITSTGCDSVYKLSLSIAPKYRFEEYDTICEGETYHWHNQDYTNPGIYYAYLQSKDGCDSVRILNLSVNKKYLFIEENTIRSNGQFSWRGHRLTAPGQYFDSLKTVYGCDSVYQLNLSYLRTQLYSSTAYICEGETYTWRRNTYTESGVYSDSMINVNGGDSVYQLNLHVGTPLYGEENVVICAGEVYEWFSEDYSESGTYYHSVESTGKDCGATYMLNLKVGEPFIKQERAYICSGGSYYWHGYDYTKAGTYYDEYKTIDGCDSIYQLDLIEYPKYQYSKVVTICEGDYYIWRNKKYTQAGIYWDSLTSIYHCDSVYQLELKIIHPFEHVEYASICDNEVYDWRGKTYHESGIYYDSLKNQYNCDSVYILHLTVNPSYKHTEFATICEGEVYEWRGRQCSQNDTYYDYYSTINGCDSIYVLNLTVQPTYWHRESAYICSGEGFIWQNELYTEPGVYTKTYSANIGGCDSVVQLNLGVAEKYYFEEEYATCEGSYYSWHGKELSESGIYWDSLLTVFGCDSVYKLTINFYPIFHFVTEATICAGDSIVWRDSVYMIDSIYYDAYSTIYECDSLYELRLTVLPTYHVYDTIAFCHGDSIQWHNNNIKTPGIYIDSLSTISSCDSIVQLTLIENPTYDFHTYDTIKEGMNYQWCGHIYTETGDYREHLYTTSGCDSILTLHLITHPKYKILTYDTICKGELYNWQNSTYSETGVYSKTYQSIYMTDSVLELHLQVMPTYYTKESVALCQGESLTWHNNTYYQTGIYYDSLRTHYGCDSIMELSLIVHPTYLIHEMDTICQGDLFFYEHVLLDTAGTYTFSYQTVNGCDSIRQLTLSILDFPVPQFPISDICADEQIISIYYEPEISSEVQYGVYFDSLSHLNGFTDILNADLSNGVIQIPIPQLAGAKLIDANSYGGQLVLSGSICKEEHVYDFTVNLLYSSQVVVQKFDDVLAVQNAQYNGGYDFTGFQWYVEGEAIPGATGSYYYSPTGLKGLYYYVVLTRSSDGTSIATCPIYPIQGTGVKDVVQCNRTDEYVYNLYNINGLLIQKGSGDDYLHSYLPQGIYFLQKQRKNGTAVGVDKLVIH